MTADLNPKDRVGELLTEREKTHGRFEDHARAACRLKEVVTAEYLLRCQRGQTPFTATQREAIDMIMHKVGRILAGDASFPDHWDDIAGYARIGNRA